MVMGRRRRGPEVNTRRSPSPGAPIIDVPSKQISESNRIRHGCKFDNTLVRCRIRKLQLDVGRPRTRNRRQADPCQWRRGQDAIERRRPFEFSIRVRRESR